MKSLREIVWVTALIVATPFVSQAVVVERVVAVVGEEPILMSDHRHRLRLQYRRIYPRLQTIPQSQQQLAMDEASRELLNAMVDEHVVAIVAKKQTPPISVTEKQVDEVLKSQAAELKVPLAQLFEEAQSRGLSETEYKNEIHRQLLFRQLYEVRNVRNRPKITEQDVRDHYQRSLMQERSRQPFRSSVIVLDLSTGTDTLYKRRLADVIVKQARAGVSFNELVRRYSIDPSRERGGDLGTRMPGSFTRQVDEALLKINVGQISEPIASGNTLMIYKITERPPSQLPSYEESQSILYERTFQELSYKQQRLWLDELKRGIHIEIRWL